MFKCALSVTILFIGVSVALLSCKKKTELPNIPNTNHMQFNLDGTVHNLSEMRPYKAYDAQTGQKSIVITAYKMLDERNTEEGLTIFIYYPEPLKAGDTFLASSRYLNTGAEFDYNGPGNNQFYLSLNGQPGSVTITEITSTYVKGTFSVTLFSLADFELNNPYPQPAHNITKGSFYAALSQ